MLTFGQLFQETPAIHLWLGYGKDFNAKSALTIYAED